MTVPFVRDATGDFVMKDPLKNAKVLADTEMTIIRTAQITSGYPAGVTATGTINDGMEYSAYFYNTYAVTFADPEISATSVSGYVDLYDVDKSTVSATQNGTTSTVTTNTLIVPAEVTAEKSEHFTDGENAIFKAIPVMVIIAIVIGVAGAIFYNRSR